jgi:uncharacterized protein YegJ (DUF2314 family)
MRWACLVHGCLCRDEITDWMYVDDGVLRGAFTVRVLLDRSSVKEREKKLSEMGVRLD